MWYHQQNIVVIGYHKAYCSKLSIFYNHSENPMFTIFVALLGKIILLEYLVTVLITLMIPYCDCKYIVTWNICYHPVV